MRLKESLADVHSDHLVEVLESHLADGRDDAVRQALPSLIERHPERAGVLHAIEQRLRDNPPLALPDLVAGDQAVVFACPNCGGTLTRQSPDSVEIICQYCGTETALDESLPGMRFEASLDPDARFGIGSFFTHDGVRWQAIGVQHFVGMLREWDNEDDEWESNRETWASWWMLNDKRELAWLEDHGKKRYWSVATVPNDPAPPASDSHAHEHGDWSLVDAAGEFSYRVREGERHLTVEPRVGASRLSIETRLDEHDKPVEIEYFVSHELSDHDVITGIGDAATLVDIDRWKRTRNVFVVTSLVVALAFVALCVTFPSRVLFRSDVELTPAMSPKAIGNVTLDQRSPVYLLSATTEPFSNDAWLAFELEVAMPDETGTGYVPFEFWRESGRDSDGNWSESDYRFDRRLRFDHSGVYHLSIAGVEGTVVDRPSSTTSVTVHSNAFSMRPSIVAGLLALALALIAQVRASGLASGAASLPPPPKTRH